MGAEEDEDDEDEHEPGMPLHIGSHNRDVGLHMRLGELHGMEREPFELHVVPLYSLHVSMQNSPSPTGVRSISSHIPPGNDAQGSTHVPVPAESQMRGPSV